jgi:hypothetical protein
MSNIVCLYVMRTTVRLPPELMTAAQRHARETGRTLTSLIEDGLRLVLKTGQQGSDHPRTPLPTWGSGGLLPGVDLDDGAALADLTEAG